MRLLMSLQGQKKVTVSGGTGGPDGGQAAPHRSSSGLTSIIAPLQHFNTAMIFTPLSTQPLPN